MKCNNYVSHSFYWKLKTLNNTTDTRKGKPQQISYNNNQPYKSLSKIPVSRPGV